MSLALPSAPPAVCWITRTLEGSGFDTWAVGGAVRDVLLGLPSGDWDLTTRARPEEVRRLFRRTVPIGVEHGTVGVLTEDGALFEVTTFRRDVETDGRRAVVAFADTVEEDLERRDFTLNAIAWHPLREEMLDPFGGADDLRSGILRSVGDPERRFAEDFLRVLRGLRFAGRFGLDIEAATWTALCAATVRLPELSAERVREELVKVLDADPLPSTALRLYARSGALAVLYPELGALVALDDPSWEGALRTLDALPRGRHPLRLAALLRPLPPREAAQILVRLRLSNVQVEETARRAAASPLPPREASEEDVRRWLARAGPRHLAAVARLDLAAARVGAHPDGRTPEGVVAAWRRARATLAARPPLDVAALALDGRDLIGLGLRPGPAFGRILGRLLDWVLEDPARNRRDLLEARALEEVGREGGGEDG